MVAGTNYKLSLKLRTKEGPMCDDVVEKFCKNIIVHQPLSFNCQVKIYIFLLDLVRFEPYFTLNVVQNLTRKLKILINARGRAFCDISIRTKHKTFRP